MKRLAVILAIVAMLVGCTDNPVAPDETVAIRYTLTGVFADATIVFTGPDGETMRLYHQYPSWTYTVSGGMDPGEQIHVSAWAMYPVLDAYMTLTVYKNDYIFRTDTDVDAWPSVSINCTS